MVDAADEDIVHHEFPDSTRVTEAWWYRTEERLVIRFPDQHRQQYLHVTEHIWTQFISAGSAGRYLHDELNQLPNSPL